MLLNPLPDDGGNVAVSWPHGRLLVRPLAASDALDRNIERRAMPHAATCQPPMVDVPIDGGGLADIVPLTRRAKRGWTPA